jgi:hypothetical protein
MTLKIDLTGATMFAMKDREMTLKIEGPGLVQSFGDTSQVSGSEISRVAMTGRLDIEGISNERASFIFDGVSFDGEILINLSAGCSLVFVSCEFAPNVKITVLGALDRLSVVGCEFGEAARMDVSQAKLKADPVFIDCEAHETASIEMPDEAEGLGWKAPLAAVAITGALALIGASSKRAKKAKRQQTHVKT